MPVLAGARRRRVTACRRLVGVTLPLAAGCTAERPEPAGGTTGPADGAAACRS
jgi:hypothetical protein